jgi:DNA-binding response OmpR family regulator
MRQVDRLDYDNRRIDILGTEDESDLRRILRFNLESQGFGVREAEDGRVALERIKEKKPDCLILDVMMPEMNGFEVCKRIKSMDKVKDIPIIFLTARGAVEDKVKAMGFDADDYMVKPFEFDELLARINLHISKSNTKQADLDREGEKVSKQVVEELARSLFEPVSKLREELVRLMDLAGENPALSQSIKKCEKYRREIRAVYIDLHRKLDPFYEPEDSDKEVVDIK